MIQDFQLNPSFNIYFDGMEYHAKIHFDDVFETEAEEIAKILVCYNASIMIKYR